MPFSCFRPSKGATPVEQAPRPVRPTSLTHNSRPKFSSFNFRRQDSNSTTNSTPSRASSNESIALLPPCRRESDDKIEALMMPVPPDTRSPQRCLRMSHPRLYASIVKEMKAEKGCRDWRNFAVFPSDDVDEEHTAEELARKKAAEYQKKLKMLESFTIDDEAMERARALIP
ncbi:hypothetical protein WHR41_04492 [Cladosporium halotolerans]|uniref:Uncharacterized protein n=1 Tax=Cladosporium halotolerans TaxID=1052096 RepID=A0AB34KRQ0_9PEZI